MNRLEDQLKAALKPEEPPPGFAERVVERLGEVPERRRGLVESILDALRPPKLRLAALGAALLIALLVGVLYYPRTDRQLPDSAGQIVSRETPAPKPPGVDPDGKTGGGQVVNVITGQPHRQVSARAKSGRKLEGEKARDRLLLAFQITSTKLTEARDAVNQSLSAGRGTR
jgi:hypothetical protein